MKNLKTPTFDDMVKKYQDLYDGTDVDELTKASLRIYFDMLNISDRNEQRWKWLWKRNLILYYPVYKQELDMWKDYRTNEWFYDKVKLNDKHHTESTTLTEDLKRQIYRDLNRTLNDKYEESRHDEGKQNDNGSLNRTFNEEYSGNRSESGTSKDTLNEKSTNNSTTNTTSNSETNSKDRNFSFNYPESNYQGGVIPYDINNNPSVEFISTQGDSLSKSNTESTDHEDQTSGGTHEATTNREYENSGTDGHTNEQTQKDISENLRNTSSDSTGNHTQDQKQTEKEGQDATENRDQKIINEYTDHYDYDGSNIIDLADKLISLIQTANFFKEFVNHLDHLFDHLYIEDDMWEEDYEF